MPGSTISSAAADLGSSIALSSLEWSIARTVGPALGGVAIATFGIAAGYAAYALLTASARRARAGPASRATPPPADCRRRAHPTGQTPRDRHLLALHRDLYDRRHALHRAAPRHRAQRFRGRCANSTASWRRRAARVRSSAASGLALAGNVRRKGRLVPLASFAGAALLALFTHVHALLPALLILGAMGAIDTLMYALANTYVQECSGDAQRGRANAIFSLAFLGGIPVGSLLLGIACRANRDGRRADGFGGRRLREQYRLLVRRPASARTGLTGVWSPFGVESQRRRTGGGLTAHGDARSSASDARRTALRQQLRALAAGVLRTAAANRAVASALDRVQRGRGSVDRSGAGRKPAPGVRRARQR